MSVVKRSEIFYLRKRVPNRYSTVEKRGTIWISLHTDSETVAHQKAPSAWQHYIEGWEARLAGDNDNAEIRFEAVKKLAAIRGFRYVGADLVADMPHNDLLDRVELVEEKKGTVDKLEATAILGGATTPEITITHALELYWTLAQDRTLGKSKDQLRRWRNPRMKAVTNFIGVVGDKEISEISGDDMLDFRQWWIDRMKTNGLTANSANKDLLHLGDILKTVNKLKRLGLNLPLSDLTFKQGEANQRPPFSKSWIKEKLLAPNALSRLNTQARCIVLGMINTGYRPSEGCGLLPEHIKLEGDVPHISIEGVGRQLKSVHSRRVIPLAGVSLEAFKQCPDGFPRYRDSPSLSATVNKYLRVNGLLETPEHSLYGLRHAFEDRMIAAGVDDRIRRDLFGHSLNRERYGKGATLNHLHQCVQLVAF
jgi:integrase